MIKLYLKNLSEKRKEKSHMIMKKHYKIYFWLLKTPAIFSYSKKNPNLFLFFYLRRRLDVLIYRFGFTSSIKQSRFIIKNLKAFNLNSITTSESIMFLKNNTVITLKSFFFKTFINLILFNIKLRNLLKKKFFWILLNSYFFKKEFSYVKRLKFFNFSRKINIKKVNFHNNVLLDTKNLNLFFI